MEKRFLLLVGNFFVITYAIACPDCNPQIRQAIFDSTFYPNLITMLSAFIILAAIVMVLSIISANRHKAYISKYPEEGRLTPVPLASAATVTGIGIGGFIDGIVFHQILQWHEMLSNKIPPLTYVAKSVNMFWDGIFHAFSLIVTVIGIILLWKLLHRKNIDRSGRLLAGGFLLGWGLFNIVEGSIDHHILKLHNVREVAVNKELWNYGFLIISVVFIVVGLILYGSRSRKDQYV